MANRWGNNENSDRLYFLRLQIFADSDCSPEIKRRLLLGRKALINLDSHRTEKVSFHSKSQRKAMPRNAQTTAQLHSSHTLVKVMLKILQTRLQQYVNQELPDVQAGFRKGRGTRDLIANIHWISEKAREFQENIYFCFIDYAKAFDCVDHNKLENSERDGNTR